MEAPWNTPQIKAGAMIDDFDSTRYIDESHLAECEFNHTIHSASQKEFGEVLASVKSV